MASTGHNYVVAAQVAETSQAVAAEVKLALADPAMFFYGALFSLTTTQRLLGESTAPEEKSLFQLLEIMAYGGAKDLTRTELAKSAVAPLITANLTDRLRELSVLSFCASSANTDATLFYDPLTAYLELPDGDDDALERILRNIISHRLIKARLHPQRRCVYVEEFAPRCVRAKDVTALKLKLQEWLRTVDGQLGDLDSATVACNEGAV